MPVFIDNSSKKVLVDSTTKKALQCCECETFTAFLSGTIKFEFDCATCEIYTNECVTPVSSTTTLCAAYVNPDCDGCLFTGTTRSNIVWCAQAYGPNISSFQDITSSASAPCTCNNSTGFSNFGMFLCLYHYDGPNNFGDAPGYYADFTPIVSFTCNGPVCQTTSICTTTGLNPRCDDDGNFCTDDSDNHVPCPDCFFEDGSCKHHVDVTSSYPNGSLFDTDDIAYYFGTTPPTGHHSFSWDTPDMFGGDECGLKNLHFGADIMFP